MTLRQLYRAFEGWARKHDREHHQWSNYVALLANCWSEDTIKPDDLYANFSEGFQDKKSSKENKPDIEELNKEMGPEAIPVERE